MDPRWMARALNEAMREVVMGLESHATLMAASWRLLAAEKMGHSRPAGRTLIMPRVDWLLNKLATLAAYRPSAKLISSGRKHSRLCLNCAAQQAAFYCTGEELPIPAILSRRSDRYQQTVKASAGYGGRSCRPLGHADTNSARDSRAGR